MEEVIETTIMERRGSSLDVLVDGKRVTLVTKWWWSVTRIGGSDEEQEEISTSDADGTAMNAECDEGGKVSRSSDSSSESFENSI